MKNFIRTGLAAAVLCLLAACASDDAPPADVIRATYVSAAGERLVADYARSGDTVRATLPDGRTLLLQRARSGSGARYTLGNEELWEHQGVLTYRTDGRVVFQGPKAAAPGK